MTTLTDAPARPAAQRSVAERAPKPHLSPEKISATITLAVLVGLAIYSLAEIDISIPNMIASWSNAENFFARVGAITFPEPGHLLYLIAFTVGLVLTGTLLAAVLSVPVAYLAAANTSPSATWRVIARGFGVLTRAVPDVVLAMVFAMMFSLGALPGILAIGLHSIGMISKMFADAIEQIDEGPRLAIRAAGGTKLQQFTSGVLPQVAPSWIATVLHRNDINLRGSVVLGYVGVAGLGFEMSQSFKSLDYGAGLGIAVVIFLLCIVMEIISSAVRAAMLPSAVAKRTWADRLFTRTAAKNAAKREAKRFAPASPEEALRRPWTRARVGNTISLTLAALIVVGAVWVCNINWGDLLTVWGKVPETLAKFWPLDFGAYGPEVLFKALGETIMIALAATLITLLPSLFVGAFAARNVAPTSGVRSLSRLVLVTIRGIPEIILAIVLIVITGLGMQAGTIAVALGGIGLLGKLIADSTEEVNPGPERALKATGATRLQVFFSATSPQNVRATIGHTFYLLDTNIRSATILGIVGGGGVGYYLLNASQGSRYGMVSLIVLMILVTVLVCEGLAMWMRRVYR